MAITPNELKVIFWTIPQEKYDKPGLVALDLDIAGSDPEVYEHLSDGWLPVSHHIDYLPSGDARLTILLQRPIGIHGLSE